MPKASPVRLAPSIPANRADHLASLQMIFPKADRQIKREFRATKTLAPG
jgi:hypothetical protein